MNEDHIEILAQAMWRGTFGETRIVPEWEAWAAQNPTTADDFRKRAEEMIGVHLSHAAKNKTAGPKTSHNSGLDWLFQ